MKISLIICIFSMLSLNVDFSMVYGCPDKCICKNNNKYVSCKNRKFSFIPSNIPKNVENLDMSQNNLVSLPSKAFVNLSILQYLNLENNQIILISNDSFEGLSSLKHLYLMKNNINDLKEGTFNSLKQLLHLHLSDNYFNHVPIVTCPTMTHLNLANNKILNVTIPVLFKPNRSLRNIVLTNNKIERISENDLESLKDTGLQSLTLTKNNLKYIHPKALHPISSSLTILKLNGNTDLSSAAIADALDSFTGSTSLTTLDLKNTGITNISHNFFKPLSSSRLNTLDLSGNSQLTSVHEESFRGLHYVQKLYLDNCKLTSLNVAPGVLESLKEIRLNENSLRQCPNGLPQSLEIIDLSNNNIVSILKEHLGHLLSLKSLVIASNVVGHIEQDSFLNLGQLTSLDLSFNRLEIVQYSNNSVISKTGMFVGCRKMSSLNLSHNKIRGWSVLTFRDHNSPLIDIDLSFNQLTSISTTADQDNYLPPHITQLRRLYLNDNPWNCTCPSVLWLLYNKDLLVKTSDIVCQYPSHVRGRKLFDMYALKNCSREYVPLHPAYIRLSIVIAGGTVMAVVVLVSFVSAIMFRKRLWRKYRRWSRRPYQTLHNATVVGPAWIEQMKSSVCVADDCVLLTQKAFFEVGRLSVKFVDNLDLFVNKVALFHCKTLVIDWPVCGNVNVVISIVKERLTQRNKKRTFVFHSVDVEYPEENDFSGLDGLDNVREYDDLVKELYSLY